MKLHWTLTRHGCQHCQTDGPATTDIEQVEASPRDVFAGGIASVLPPSRYFQALSRARKRFTIFCRPGQRHLRLAANEFVEILEGAVGVGNCEA